MWFPSSRKDSSSPFREGVKETLLEDLNPFQVVLPGLLFLPLWPVRSDTLMAARKVKSTLSLLHLSQAQNNRLNRCFPKSVSKKII